ncbi:MAG: hypothetical protein GY851_33665 [bacterium]|nr:hypothetical protein [bacterium]
MLHGIVALGAMASLILCCGMTQALEFHIAPDGDDANAGTAAAPFATLHRAQEATRSLKSEGELASPVDIVLRKGRYHLHDTLVLGPEDSGTPEAPIVWRAAPSETVILSGGRPITGVWQTDDGKTWHVDVPEAQGWARNPDIPESYSPSPTGPWNFRQLFVDGQRAIRARFPNVDAENPFLYASGGSMAHVDLPKGHVRPGWTDEPDAQINIVANWRFFNQWNDVVRVDADESVLYLGVRERHGKIIKGNWFWIEGVRSELDQPGEWYLDPREGRLYYVPDEGQDPNKMEFIAPYLNRVVHLKGDVERGTQVEHVQFKGLDFRHTTFTLGHIEARVHTDAAVMLENASNCRVEECRFEAIGGYALWLHLDSRRNVFHANTVQDSGGGGVLMTGSRLSYMDDTKVYTPGEAAAKVAPILNEVTYNTVSHCGKLRYYGGGVHMDSRPASMAMMPGNYIAHNHFQDLSRNGIFAFRNQGGNVVEYNHIHDCMQTTIDGACIHFATMTRLNAANYILSNFLHDIWGYEQLPNGKPKRHLANGVFLDWDTSNTTVKHNYIYNAGGQPVKTIWNNWDLTVADNHSANTPIEPPFLDETGPGGTATHGIRPADLARRGRIIHYTEKELVSVAGDWKPETAEGLSGLFRFSFLKVDADTPASATFRLPIEEPGAYLVCLRYKPGESNATEGQLRIDHAGGQDTRTWDFSKGHNNGFAVKVGVYRFEPDAPASVTISNEGADGPVVADSVVYVKTEEP